MNSAFKLFMFRLKGEWKFQFAVFRTAVDWTVALYMVIPAVAYCIYHYLHWWRELPPWLTYIPFNLVVTLIFLFSWSGTIRIFLAEADQLFLIQCKPWINAITRYSVAYSTALNLSLTALVFLTLTPFCLFFYHLSVGQLLAFGLFSFGAKQSLAVAKQLLALRFKGWAMRLFQGILFFLTGLYFYGSSLFLEHSPVLFGISSLIILVIMVILLRKRVTLRGAFFEDVTREQYERMKLANLLLRASGYHVKKLRTIRNRPLLFRKSNLLFQQRTPANALCELCIKSVLRNGGHIKSYLQLLGVGLALELVLPQGWNLGLWLVFVVIMTNFVALFWRETMNSPFVQLFHWKPEARVTAAGNAMFLLTLPGFLLLSLALGLKNFTWLGALGMLPTGGVLAYVSAKVISIWKA